MAVLLYPEESYKIVGACFAVYNDKGCGFLEPVYQECLAFEFRHLQIPAVTKPGLVLSYRGQNLEQTYEPDFVCYGKIIIEIKAVSELIDKHRAQVLNYLHATGFKLGILVNFGSHPELVYERIALSTKEHPMARPAR